METAEPHVEAHEAKVTPENPSVTDMGVSSVATSSVSNEGSSQDEGEIERAGLKGIAYTNVVL